MHLIPPEAKPARPNDKRRSRTRRAGAEMRLRPEVNDLPRGSCHSEEISLAVLRRRKDHNDEQLVVDFGCRDCDIELTASGRIVLCGAWQIEIARQGRLLVSVSDWESICWHSDADVDYLELQIELSEKVIVQRHMILARADRFLLLADAVLSPNPGGLEYRGVAPLAAGVVFRPATDTREGILEAGNKGRGEGSKGRGAIAKVMPLALPEWRKDLREGDLAATDCGLELRQATERQRLFAPLLVDLDRARFRRRLTWRPLTVAESLTAVPADRAVGCRVAIGKQQWLIYRSLAPKGNRTLLGHNLSTETLVARFAADGEVTPIIEIE
jgi:hypothetical protein